MSKTTIVLKADRVATTYVKDRDAARLVVCAFRPSGASVTRVQTAEREDEHFVLDIDDETGEYTSGVTWSIQMLTVADDRKAFTMILLKP